MHIRSAQNDALPLLITHGWPGSIVEFLDVIGPLTGPGLQGGDPADAFHLVIPTIPGYGLSGPTRDGGWDVHRMAKAWAELMQRLGYHRYGAQGGDLGHAITRELAAIGTDHVVAIHLNTLLTPLPNDPAEAAELTDKGQARLDLLTRSEPEMSGYAKIQGTRPQTLAYALTDSPVGQLAWIAEKFKEWTDWEAFHPSRPSRAEPLETPTGVAVFAAGKHRASGRLPLVKSLRTTHDVGPHRPAAQPVQKSLPKPL
ncbi:alpha/beta hydrolase fold [Streptomyces sp. MnatMP-M17]|nr:alpha/beta hydrolase fold [Streptomyces sp. MnatMP-M17]